MRGRRERVERKEVREGTEKRKVCMCVWQGVRGGDVKWVERREDGAKMEYGQVKWRRWTVIAALVCETAQCLIQNLVFIT